MSKVGIFLRKDFLSLNEEAKKLAGTLGNADVVDYQEYKKLKPPLYYPRHMIEEWYRTHKIEKYNKAVFLLPYQRLEVSMMLGFSGYAKAEKEIWYTVTEGITKHISGFTPQLNRKIIVTPSNFSKRCIEETGAKVKEVIPHQADNNLEIDEDFGLKWRAKYPKDKKLLVYIGNPARRKGLLELKEAVEILARKRKDFHVVIHTINQPKLQGYNIKQLEHSNITLELEFGLISKAQALAKMKYADFYVHPAKGEGFGLPVLEALQLGKPLICINAFGVNEIANRENSFMVEPYSESLEDYPPTGIQLTKFKVVNYHPKDLAETIDMALDSPKSLIQEKIAKGFETVEKFRNTYKRFKELLGG